MKILIVGGSGFVGVNLTKVLQAEGHEVAWLGRSSGQKGTVKQYMWNWASKQIDTECLQATDTIINLAGANVGAKRWTEAYKKEIYESRVLATNFLFETLKKVPNRVKRYISASGVGFYEAKYFNKIATERDTPGTDFLAQTCQAWEQAAKQMETLGIATTIFRFGVVVDAEAEAFKKLSMPISMGVGAALGSGLQKFAWIHVHDLCQMVLHSIHKNLSGIYNSVAPETIDNKTLTTQIAQHYKKPYFLPNVPAFVLKVILGEFADSLLQGSAVSSEKIVKTGFRFRYQKFVDFLESV